LEVEKCTQRRTEVLGVGEGRPCRNTLWLLRYPAGGTSRACGRLIKIFMFSETGLSLCLELYKRLVYLGFSFRPMILLRAMICFER
jgi:hypothetical protein